MEKLKGDRMKAIRIEKVAGQTRLREQKTHYENIVTRHQGFIEQVNGFVILPQFSLFYLKHYLSNHQHAITKLKQIQHYRRFFFLSILFY